MNLNYLKIEIKVNVIKFINKYFFFKFINYKKKFINLRK
jgi:hypothetical protein